MPKQSAGAAIHERHKISSAESDQVVSILRRAADPRPASGVNIGELAESSGYSWTLAEF